MRAAQFSVPALFLPHSPKRTFVKLCPLAVHATCFSSRALGLDDRLLSFLGRPATEPPLLPCPITMLADERLHGPALHHRILLNLGADGTHSSSISLQSPLPGLPAEQLLFLPPDLGWNDVILPIDLRPLGGGICLVRDQRSATCGQLLAAALEVQGRFRALHGVLGRCCLGWFSLGSQPLILPGVDALQFAYGPRAKSSAAPIRGLPGTPLHLGYLDAGQCCAGGAAD